MAQTHTYIATYGCHDRDYNLLISQQAHFIMALADKRAMLMAPPLSQMYTRLKSQMNRQERTCLPTRAHSVLFG